MTTPTHEEIASRLLARLRPLFPSIASATRTEADARAWVASWALVIRAEGLSPSELWHGLENIAKAPSERPLTPAVFLSLCRPRVGSPGEAYIIKPAAMPEPPDRRAARLKRGREACAALLAVLLGRPAAGDKIVPSPQAAAEHLSKIDPGRKKIFP